MLLGGPKVGECATCIEALAGVGLDVTCTPEDIARAVCGEGAAGTHAGYILWNGTCYPFDCADVWIKQLREMVEFRIGTYEPRRPMGGERCKVVMIDMCERRLMWVWEITEGMTHGGAWCSFATFRRRVAKAA